MNVEVVLIPNIHLETPNYNIVRVKHDDVTEETSRASYKLVELPTETSYIPNAEETAKAVRPVAAVKGITPAAPAPIVDDKLASKMIAAPALSLFSRIKNFFGGSSGATEKQKTDAEKVEESNRERNRNNRNRNNRNRNDRNKNAPQNRNNEAKPQEAKAQDQRQQKPQQNQQPRPDQVRNDKPRNNNQQANVNPTAVGAEVSAIEAGVEKTTERTGSNRRNRNNRRGRRDRVENTAADNSRTFIPNEEIATNPANVNVEAIATPVNVEPKQAQVAQPTTAKVDSMVETNSNEAPKAKADRRQRPAKATANSVDEVKPSADTTTQPTASATIETGVDVVASKTDNKRPARPRKPKAAAKPIDLAAVGLQLVETKADAPKVVTPADEAKPRAPRKVAAWQKETKSKTDSEPMVMVETQNK
jgi:ribonuclease E